MSSNYNYPEFFKTRKEMMKAVEASSKFPNDQYYIARMCGVLESELMDLPPTLENIKWMKKVIERSNKRIEECKEDVVSTEKAKEIV